MQCVESNKPPPFSGKYWTSYDKNSFASYVKNQAWCFFSHVTIVASGVPLALIVPSSWSLCCNFQRFRMNIIKKPNLKQIWRLQAVPSSVSSFAFWHLAPAWKIRITSHFLFLMLSSQSHRLQEHQFSHHCFSSFSSWEDFSFYWW